jgi:4-hydroxy-tetrahydrodipicolinate reductase
LSIYVGLVRFGGTPSKRPLFVRSGIMLFMVLYVAGSGKLANTLYDYALKEGVETVRWSSETKSSANGILIHAGSGRALSEVIQWCEQLQIPLIQASTGSDEVFASADCPVIIAPNLSLPIVVFVEKIIPAAKVLLDLGMKVSITESHQKDKKSVAGTAEKIANNLGVPSSAIKSVRDREELHAEHQIVFEDKYAETQITLETKVKGGKPYAVGGLQIAQLLDSKRDKLGNQIYSIEEVFHL